MSAGGGRASRGLQAGRGWIDGALDREFNTQLRRRRRRALVGLGLSSGILIVSLWTAEVLFSANAGSTAWLLVLSGFVLLIFNVRYLVWPTWVGENDPLPLPPGPTEGADPVPAGRGSP